VNYDKDQPPGIVWRYRVKLTAGQQEEPQHNSPGLQNVLPQQVAFIGTQKGGTLFNDGMQHFSGYNSRQSLAPYLG